MDCNWRRYSSFSELKSMFFSEAVNHFAMVASTCSRSTARIFMLM